MLRYKPEINIFIKQFFTKCSITPIDILLKYKTLFFRLDSAILVIQIAAMWTQKVNTESNQYKHVNSYLIHNMLT